MTTIRLEESIFAQAASLAEARGLSVEEMISKLISEAKSDYEATSARIQQGLASLGEGKGIDGEAFFAELLKDSQAA